MDAQWTLTICRFFIPFLVLIFVPKGDPVRGRSVAAPPQPPVLCPHPPPPLHLQLLRRPRPLPPMENASLFEFSLCLCQTSMIEEFERQNKDIMRYAWLIWFLSAGAQRLTTDCSSTVPVSCTGSADQSQEVLGLHRPYRTATPSAALASACTLLRMHFDLLFC